MTVVLTWAGGIIGGAAIAIGMIELVTGRMVILPRPWTWTLGEAKFHGLVVTTVGLVFAIKSLVDGLVLPTATGPSWRGPAWWNATTWLWPLCLLVLGFTPLLLEQNHNRRWPFSRVAKGGTVRA